MHSAPSVPEVGRPAAASRDTCSGTSHSKGPTNQTATPGRVPSLLCDCPSLTVVPRVDPRELSPEELPCLTRKKEGLKITMLQSGERLSSGIAPL